MTFSSFLRGMARTIEAPLLLSSTDPDPQPHTLETGAGKTTLLECISLRNRNFDGAVHYDNRPPSGEFFTRSGACPNSTQRSICFGPSARLVGGGADWLAYMDQSIEGDPPCPPFLPFNPTTTSITKHTPHSAGAPEGAAVRVHDPPGAPAVPRHRPHVPHAHAGGDACARGGGQFSWLPEEEKERE
jgi:hypothetical protein